MELTREIAQKVLDIVDAGLVKGLGVQVPGKMCIEAAVCFALGLPHSDNPPCVGYAVRQLKISLNDKDWSSDAARAKGLRRIAIAQLGSVDVDQAAFMKLVAEGVIRGIVPIALRAAASMQKDKKHKDALEEAAVKCEKEGDKSAANAADMADASTFFSKDQIFTMLAEIAVRALVKLGSQGSKWLDLCPLPSAIT